MSGEFLSRISVLSPGFPEINSSPRELTNICDFGTKPAGQPGKPDPALQDDPARLLLLVLGIETQAEHAGGISTRRDAGHADDGALARFQSEGS